jgi:hypothetical protein
MRRKEIDDTSSIETTKRLLVSSLENIEGENNSIEFVTETRLSKPSFGFIHSIIKILVVHKFFAKGLFSDDELYLERFTTRKDKIMFLFKIISCVSYATEEKMMFFISPVQILCGKEVNKTRYFLTKLLQVASLKSELMEESIERAFNVGFLSLYKNVVRTRIGFINLQSVIRKRLYLRKMNSNKPYFESNINKECFSVSVSQDHSGFNETKKCENDNISKSLQIPKKKLKKIKILNGIKYIETIDVKEENKTETHIDNRSEEERKKDEIQQLETELRRKLRKLSEQEMKLKEQVNAAQAKEELLKIHEERVKKLACTLRRQQEKVKDDERRNSSEMDKMLLQLAEKTSGHVEKRSLECFDSKNLEFGDDLLRKACDNPTITDLRLALEHKNRSLRKRSQKIAKAEKELKAQAEELRSMRARLQSLLETEDNTCSEGRLLSPKIKKIYKAKIFDILSEQDLFPPQEQSSESNITLQNAPCHPLYAIDEESCCSK